MSRRKNLYIVYAGTTSEGCHPVYETTKREKAEKYLYKVVMRQERYTKAYIDCIHNVRDDKRSRWKED